MPAFNDATVRLLDGRRLAYTEWGTPDGPPVVYFHGTPGSRIWCPDEVATLESGVRLIIPDRPGIGASDPKVPRMVGDWPADILELMDSLGVATFAVVGVSAGGSYTAACAALIPDRLTSVSIVSSSLSTWCWEERPGIEATWDADDRAVFELIRRDLPAGIQLASDQLITFAQDIIDHPQHLRDELAQAQGDGWFFEDDTRVEQFNAYLRDTFAQGVDAAVWEFAKIFLPWGFRLADITIPVRICHGAQDPWVTEAGIDFQVRTIPRTTLTVWEDAGHLAFVKHWGEILRTAAAGRGSAA